MRFLTFCFSLLALIVLQSGSRPFEAYSRQAWYYIIVIAYPTKGDTHQHMELPFQPIGARFLAPDKLLGVCCFWEAQYDALRAAQETCGLNDLEAMITK